MKRVIARRQALLLAPLLACSRLYFQILSIAFTFRHPGAGLRDLPLMAVHHAIFVGLPLVLLELPLAAAFLVVSYAVTGLYMGIVFMPNHWGMPLLSASRSGVAPSEQVRVTRNVATGAVGDWLWGGLNYQIEHHLFPDMPRAAMPAAARCVAAFCAREGIAYHQLSPLAAWAEVLQHAHVVGAALRRPQGTGALGRPC